MIYLLLILFPVAMSAGCFVLRKQTQPIIVAAVVTMLTQMALVWQVPLDTPSRLLGLTINLDPLGRLFLLGFFAVAALAFTATWWLPHGENFVPVSMVMLSFAGSTVLFLQEPFIVTLLLVSAGVLAVLAIVDLPTGSPLLVRRNTIATALKYLVLMVVAGMMMVLAFVLLDLYQPDQALGRVSPARLIMGMFAVGFGLRLGMVPFHSWLPDLAEDTEPMVPVIIVTVINVTTLLFLTITLQYHPEIVFENERGILVLQALGVTTAILGAMLALANNSLRRTLGYLVVHDSGMLLYGLASISSAGLAGALLGAFNQMLAVLLLFVCVGLLERPDGRPPHLIRHDLLRRWPIAGAGFLAGGLALLGIPPLSGFANRLLIYQAAAAQGGISLALLLGATTLALLALMRLAHQRLLGASEDQPADVSPLLLGETELDRPATRRLEREPRGAALLVTALVAVCLVIGLYPEPILRIINDVIGNLTFVRVP